MITKYLISIGVLLAILVGCSGSQKNIDSLRNPLGLYVSALKSEDWKYLYSLQSEKLRKLMSFEYFSNQMAEDCFVTQIISYEIHKGKVRENYGLLEVTYNIKTSLFDEKNQKFRENIPVVLKKIGGEWAVIHSGLEKYFPSLENKLSSEEMFH